MKNHSELMPYTIHIPATALADLNARLAATRWPDAVADAGWDYGANLAYLQELVAYWQNTYNWGQQEAALNQFHNYREKVDGYELHFIYEKGQGSSNTPLVLLHGWPSSFVQMLKIIPLLTKPDKNGHAFDVMVPSLVGYGFSSSASTKGMNVYAMAQLFHKLLTEKHGYDKFMLRATDLGAGVAKEWALSYPKAVLGLHLSGSQPYIYQVPNDLSEAEKKFVATAQQFIQTEGAYAMEQSSKPQTLAYGLNDSPVGLAAWIIEKFRAWSDCKGKVENRFSKDELLTNISIYWFTQTINSSIRLYYESVRMQSPNGYKPVSVPTAFYMLQHDITVAPREWEARTYHNIVRWNSQESGGHFAEWEEPAALAKDLFAFRDDLLR